jgi:hypothetical protein
MYAALGEAFIQIREKAKNTDPRTRVKAEILLKEFINRLNQLSRALEAPDTFPPFRNLARGSAVNAWWLLAWCLLMMCRAVRPMLTAPMITSISTVPGKGGACLGWGTVYGIRQRHVVSVLVDELTGLKFLSYPV